MTSEKLSQAVQLIKSGNRTAALPILKEVVKTEPNNENAWLWLHSCVENVEQKKYCLQQALKINPNNQDTHNALLKLENRMPTKSQSINREVDYSPRPVLDHRANDEKRSVKKSKASFPPLLVGLFAIGVFCLTATLIFLFVQRNTGIFENLPFLTSAKFESMTGNPSIVSSNIDDPWVVNSNVQLTINYPTEIKQGGRVKLTITCVNNSDTQIENFHVGFWGKASPVLGVYVNYFDGISVVSTDSQIIETQVGSSGQLYFDTGAVKPGESKSIFLNISANLIGVYNGEIDVFVDQNGESGIAQFEILTTVK